MWQGILVLLLIPLLASCSFFPKQAAAPVIVLDSAPVTTGEHIVQRGESLYSIAWRYGRDYRDIAQSNHIAPPYVIYPGQKLTLKRAALGIRETSSTKPVRQAKNTKDHSAIESSSLAKIDVSPMISLKNDWVWPAKGNIVKHYSAKGVGLKGIDIAGQKGSQIFAANAGKIVYSGSGLRGYGQLVIIKHNETFLSAYAHNSRLLVTEGETVSKGQVIALMGNSDTDQVKLHFEIRKNGQPINPLTCLPPRAA